jgi:CubicO group peptidase (beta-lactamase class C family)
MKINSRLNVLAAMLLFLVFYACKNAPEIQSSTLQRSVPEAEGVSSEAIITFLDSAAASDNEFHSIVILRHGKVIAEGWWKPYASDLKHTLYSTSKSFTSTAIGFAVSEKLLTVEDKVVSFFPDYLPDTVSSFLAGLTIKDLLTMTVGQDPDPTSLIRSADSNWVKKFLSVPIINEPGTKFLYNSLATYMLSAIVQKVTGEKIVDYLTPRLFEPLAIQGMDWEEDPMGINTGGWGLRVKTEDLAKFGQLYLQKGMWNGKQIIPAAWIEEATTAKIEQDPKASQSRKDSSDWLQGYCYQFWRCRNNAFRGDGAYGQFIIVIPEKDVVIAITAETSDMQDEINLVWKYLLPAFNSDVLPENTTMVETLKQKLAALALSPAASSPNAPVASSLTNTTISLEPNDSHLKSLSMEFAGDTCSVIFNRDNTEYPVNFGHEMWIEGSTAKPGPSLIGRLGGINENKVAGSYCWKDENTLELVLRYIESPHHETFTCEFDKSKALVSIAPSLAFGRYKEEIRGTVGSKE